MSNYQVDTHNSQIHVIHSDNCYTDPRDVVWSRLGLWQPDPAQGLQFRKSFADIILMYTGSQTLQLHSSGVGER